MKKILHLILALLPLIISAQSNRDVDSLKTIVQAGKEDTTTINTIKVLCIKLMEIGNFSEAKSYAEKELTLSRKIGYKRGTGNAYMQIGNADSWLGNYADASKSFFSALKIREELKDIRGTGTTYMTIGNVNLYGKNYRDAIRYYLLSMGMQKQINNKSGVGDCYNNIAISLSSQGEYAEAIENYAAALDIYKEINKQSAASYVYWGMAVIYSEQGDYDNAMKNYQQALGIMKKINDTKGIAGLYSDMGVSYIKQKKYTGAKRILKEAVMLSRKTGDKNTTKESYDAMSRADSATANYKSAYENYKMFSQYKDSLFNETSVKKMTQNQMQYEFDKKENAAKAAQDKKNAIAAQEKQRQKIVTYSIAGGLLLVILFAVFIFRSLRITRKQKHLIELQKNEVARQKIIVDEQNKDMTDSIHYASRIQKAILPPDDFVNRILPEHFIYYVSRDIISGDSFFVDEKNGKTIWASIDATGHSLNGGMINMLSNNILSEIVKRGETTPSKILDKLNEKFNESLHKTGEDSVRDGLDITICSLDKEKMVLDFSGANNPLWVIAGATGELLEFKTDKKAIGQLDKKEPYTNHSIQLGRGDIIYSFSDGICDLHNPENKKFMKKRLRELLLSVREKPMAGQKQIISDTLSQWKGDAQQVDDMILVAIKI